MEDVNRKKNNENDATALCVSVSHTHTYVYIWKMERVAVIFSLSSIYVNFVSFCSDEASVQRFRCQHFNEFQVKPVPNETFRNTKRKYWFKPASDNNVRLHDARCDACHRFNVQFIPYSCIAKNQWLGFLLNSVNRSLNEERGKKERKKVSDLR